MYKVVLVLAIAGLAYSAYNLGYWKARYQWKFFQRLEASIENEGSSDFVNVTFTHLTFKDAKKLTEYRRGLK